VSRDGTPAVQVSSVEPRIFGAVPPALALVLGFAGIVGGIAALASGAAAAAIVLLLAGLTLSALALDASRRWPTSAIPRVTARVAEGVGSRLGLARASAGAWSGASREVLRLRGELRALQGERDAELLELGEAAYREDDERVGELRRRLTELDEGISERESAMSETRGRARERVRRERAAVPHTQSFAVAEVEPPPGEDADTRTIPTAERPSR
jgi:hypothetical protein